MATKELTFLALNCGKCGTKYRTAEDKTDHDVSRDITQCERVAMAMWGHQYAQSGQSARCFFRSLDNSRKKVVRDVLAGILDAKKD